MFDSKTVADVFFSILTVVPRTLGLALIILTLAITLGAGIALIRVYEIPVLRRVARVFTSYMRGTPLVVHLYITYFALPRLAVFIGGVFSFAVDPNAISPITVVLLTYSLYAAAYQSENIRGALASVEFGQIEAAHSIGMTPLQTFFRITAPQALIVATPNFCNGYVGTIKALSLAYMVSVVDIMAQAKLCSALNFRYIESYLAAAIVYWILCGVFTFIFAKLEQRLSRGRAKFA